MRMVQRRTSERLPYQFKDICQQNPVPFNTEPAKFENAISMLVINPHLAVDRRDPPYLITEGLKRTRMVTRSRNTPPYHQNHLDMFVHGISVIASTPHTFD